MEKIEIREIKDAYTVYVDGIYMYTRIYMSNDTLKYLVKDIQDIADKHKLKRTTQVGLWTKTGEV